MKQFPKGLTAKLTVMAISVAVSLILTKACENASWKNMESYYALRLFLMLAAWVSGMLIAGHFLLAPPCRSGFKGKLIKAACVILSAGAAFGAAWLMMN